MCLILCILCSLAAIVVGSDDDNRITDEIFFDVKVERNGTDAWGGRFVVGLFGDALPITTYNFISLAKGFKHREETWHFKSCAVHRVVPDFLIQMGDVLYRDGRGGRSIYAPYFIDESFVHSHRSSGYVAMANSGVDSNGSQFYVTLARARWLDGRNVVFGKIVSGMEVVRRIGELDTDEFSIPKQSVKIKNCGALVVKEPYVLSEDDLDSDDDLKKGPVAPDMLEL